MRTIALLLHKGALLTSLGFFLVIVNNAFDLILYPIVMCKAGALYGVLIMTVLSIPFNAILIRGFELIGREIVLFPGLWRFLTNVQSAFANTAAGTGLISGVKSLQAKVWWLIRRSRIITFVVMSAWDPIPAMLFWKNVPELEGKMSKSDKVFFLLSTLIANAVWGMFIYLGIEVVQHMENEIRVSLEKIESLLNFILGVSGTEVQLDFISNLIGACVI